MCSWWHKGLVIFSFVPSFKAHPLSSYLNSRNSEIELHPWAQVNNFLNIPYPKLSSWYSKHFIAVVKLLNVLRCLMMILWVKLAKYHVLAKFVAKLFRKYLAIYNIFSIRILHNRVLNGTWIQWTRGELPTFASMTLLTWNLRD